MTAGLGTDAPSLRARGAALFAAFSALLVLLAAVPLALSPPTGLRLEGPSLMPAGSDAVFSGRFTFAGVGLAGAAVDVHLDGVLLERVHTGPDGAFEARVRVGAPGPHAVHAVAAPGRHVEARTEPLAFRAVEAPAAPVGARAADGALSWDAPAPDADRPVQAYRVYAQRAGAPWEEVASLGPDARQATIPPGAARYAVAAANVAGESAWAVATA